MFIQRILICILLLHATPLVSGTNDEEKQAFVHNFKHAQEEGFKRGRAASEKIDADIKAIDKQLEKVMRDFDTGVTTNKTVFEARTAELNKKRADLQNKIARMEERGDQATKLLSGAFNALIEIDKERQLAEIRKQNADLEIDKAGVVASITQTEANKGAVERLKQTFEFLQNPEALRTITIYGSLATLGITVSYYGGELIIKQVNKHLDKIPQLATETSRAGIVTRIKNGITKWWYPTAPARLADDLVFPADVQKNMTDIATQVGLIRSKGLWYANLLMFGQLGTAQTEFASWLARITDMDYALMSGADLRKLPLALALQQLDELFIWAQNCPNGMILFIDEIDAIAGKRTAQTSPDELQILNKLLALTGNDSQTLMLIGATNRENALDTAILNRFAQHVNIPLPGVAERSAIFELYLKKYITNCTRTILVDGKKQDVTLKLDPLVTADVIKQLAQKTAGLSGRQIKQMVHAMQTACFFDNYVLTPTLINTTVDKALKTRVTAG